MSHPPRYAVVTPYFKEDKATLAQCIESVRAQTVPADHILVADGYPQDWVDSAGVRHVKLDRNHNNYGNTPRAVGAFVAVDYEAICLLDADNYLDPTHVEHCLQVALVGRSAHDLVIARRRFVRLDGSTMPLSDELSSTHVDTSCFFFLPRSFYTLPVWGLMPREVAPICDRIFLEHIRLQAKLQKLSLAYATQTTVNYRSKWQSMYHAIGERPPPDAQPNISPDAIERWFDGLSREQLEHYSRRVGFKLHKSRLFGGKLGHSINSN